MSGKNAFLRYSLWVLLALFFNLGIYLFLGMDKALAFLGGYIIEQSLSLDNLFLFLLIFENFGVHPRYQKRILTYGIFSAVVLRLLFIFLGITFINKFTWLLYFFGALLIVSGVNMTFKKEENTDFKQSNITKIIGKCIPIYPIIETEKFFIFKYKKFYATPLLVVLLLIEGSDIIFAIDSIPAIFSITTDLFIVYTSNIFAILGLRNLYFLLQTLHKNFYYIRFGIALVLIFTGLKLSLIFFNFHVPLLTSLFIIFIILLSSILLSLFVSKK